MEQMRNYMRWIVRKTVRKRSETGVIVGDSQGSEMLIYSKSAVGAFVDLHLHLLVDAAI